MHQESLRPDIVQGSVAREAAICPKYSSALNINNQQLVSTVVEKTVAAVAANPITAPFFNGTDPNAMMTGSFYSFSLTFVICLNFLI